MDLVNSYHCCAAAFTARIVLAFLFFFQGYDAVVKVGMKNAADALKQTLEGKGIPSFVITLSVYFNSLTELFCGFLLLIGLGYYPSLYLLAGSLILAAVGFGIHTALWDTKHYLPRLLLLLFLLSIPEEWNCGLLDQLIFGK